MSRIAIFGATGNLGQYTWKAAVDAGHTVTVLVRSPEKLDRADARHAKLTVVVGDVLDGSAVKRACAQCDAVVNCTSPASGNATIDLARSVVINAKAAGVTVFYMVGGLGALWAPGSNKTVLMQDWDDTEGLKKAGMPTNMPRDMIRRMTQGHLQSMEFLSSSAVQHTFLCPGQMVDGPATAGRVVTLDEVGGPNPARVNLGDVAQTIIDDVGIGRLLGHRVCVASASLPGPGAVPAARTAAGARSGA